MNLYVAYAAIIDCTPQLYGITTSLDQAKALCQAVIDKRYPYRVEDFRRLQWTEPVPSEHGEYAVAVAWPIGIVTCAVARFAVGM